MGRPVPPLPLSKAEIDRRIRNGARTFQEIDPELWRWHQAQMRFYTVSWIVMFLATLPLVAVLLYGVYLDLVNR